MSTDIKSLFSREEMRELTRKSDLRGLWAVTRTWLIIALSLAGLAAFPHPLSFLLAVLVIGGQQLACAVLAHEAAHRTLFKTPWMNNQLTDWLCARPVWTDVERYRQHHMRHHAHTGTQRDPDMGLVDPFPTSQASLRRKLLRDVIGLSGLRRMFGLILMDLGILKYSVSGQVERLPLEGRTLQNWLDTVSRNFGPVLITNLALAAVLYACGALWLYSAWLVAYLTSFSLYLRIRSIAEHACLPGGDEIHNNTRTTIAGWLARWTVAPLHVNFHQEHHLMASVPYYRLPQMHKMLSERRDTGPTPHYLDVLHLAGAN